MSQSNSPDVPDINAAPTERLDRFVEIIHQLANAELEGEEAAKGRLLTLDAAQRAAQSLPAGDPKRQEVDSQVVAYQTAFQATDGHEEKISAVRFKAVETALQTVVAKKAEITGIQGLRDVVGKVTNLREKQKNAAPNAAEQQEITDLQEDLERLDAEQKLAQLKGSLGHVLLALSSIKTQLQVSPDGNLPEDTAIKGSLLGLTTVGSVNEIESSFLTTEIADEVETFKKVVVLPIFKSTDVAQRELSGDAKAKKGIQDHVRPASYDEDVRIMSAAQRRWTELLAQTASVDKADAKGENRLRLEQDAGAEAQRVVTGVRAELDSLVAESGIILDELFVAGGALLGTKATLGFSLQIVEALKKSVVPKNISPEAFRAVVSTSSVDEQTLRELFGNNVVATIPSDIAGQLKSVTQGVVTKLETTSETDASSNIADLAIHAGLEKLDARMRFEAAKAKPLPAELKSLPLSLRADEQRLLTLFEEMDTRETKTPNDPERDKQRAIDILEALFDELTHEQLSNIEPTQDNLQKNAANKKIIKLASKLLEKMKLEKPSVIVETGSDHDAKISDHPKTLEAVTLFNNSLQAIHNKERIAQNMDAVRVQIARLAVRLFGELVKAEDEGAKAQAQAQVSGKAEVSYAALHEERESQRKAVKPAAPKLPDVQNVTPANVRDARDAVASALQQLNGAKKV